MRNVFLRPYVKPWTAAVAVCTATLILAALFLPRSFQLTALSDGIQCALLLSGTLALIPNAIRAHGRLRAFWALLAIGMAFWFSYQAMWTYYEIILRTDVPDMCAGDIILFLHIVPFMAALSLRPHVQQDEYAARLRRLDFALMMVWWIYLYIFAVMAWQYVVPNILAYDNNLNFLYLIEKLAFLTGLFMAWLNSRAGWKFFYANLFGASLTYASSSYFANWAISRHLYYSGSLYDIPLAASMIWITLLGLWAREDEPQKKRRAASTSLGLWLSRAGMITVTSLPLFAAWALLGTAIPSRIRSFRLVLTLGTALFMGIMVFVRQRRLDHELLHLLSQSQESLANLKRLQAQITESEKLASVGQLVAGAAHELNNPITAMMGYSDLLLTTALSSEQQTLAARVGQHVRRARLLVATLLSFAKQGPAAIVPMDIKTVLRTAVKLTEPVWHTLKIDVQTDLQAELPAILGDSNLLLQMCVQIFNNVASAADQQGIRNLSLITTHEAGQVVISILEVKHNEAKRDEVKRDEAKQNPEFIQPADKNGAENPGVSDQPLAGLGLTACQSILQQHRGKISCQSNGSARISIRVELPTIPAPEKSPALPAPPMWQPQSFV